MTAPKRIADRLRGIPPPVFMCNLVTDESDNEIWRIWKYAPGGLPECIADFKYQVDAKIFQAMKTDSYNKS